MSEYIFKDEIVYISDSFTIGQDWEYPIPAFFILAPNRKIRTIDEFTEEEASEYIFLVRKLRKGMKEILMIEDVYFFQNEDTKHDYHLWIFPRYDWMEPFGRGIKSVKPILEYSIKEMMNENVFAEVRSCVHKMKLFMKNS
ncbi:MAG: diadenosine tetraphosphate hydrolase [Ignavibacteria bacterium]|nr:diadenosine tetraphosphate hydrolase [Ignavibacteria bacterium]